jgi:hypothetical protein
VTGSAYSKGDVFWAPDPYNAGGNPRPWLVLTADGIPFDGEEYICAGLTLSDHAANFEVGQQHWELGYNPDKTSYCSPWVLATVKHDAVANPQGAVTAAFADRMIREARDYVTADL